MSDTPGIPDDLLDLVTTDRLGHVSCIRPDGEIVTNLMWIDWDGDHILTSSRVGSRKGGHWRRNPQASVSVVDRDDPWRYVIVRGEVIEFRPDEGLRFIDKMSVRYTGASYFRRSDEREIFVIRPARISAAGGRRG